MCHRHMSLWSHPTDLDFRMDWYLFGLCLALVQSSHREEKSKSAIGFPRKPPESVHFGQVHAPISEAHCMLVTRAIQYRIANFPRLKWN
mmetsp:Transcript_3671/g.8061  ORF Transcript_3671/g.8061 Transcript_3671/m.8061 type:complete len:89 (-) Transcript_3671:728-994(-)